MQLHSRHYIPDTAMNALIKFLYMFFVVLSRISTSVEGIRNHFPSSLSKLNIKTDHFTRYVVCPRCSELYLFQDSKDKIGTESISKKCSHVRFPKHPHQSQRGPCSATLLKQVTTTTGQKFVYPLLSYCYKSLISSFQQLLLVSDFYAECQSWRTRNGNSLSDIYDGRIWKHFRYDSTGSKLLESTYTFAFMLNIDWFQPFLYTTYSVGVVYLSVLNLPRHLRFKRQNIILISIIPGPSEPKHDINSYLRPLVKELLDLWEGVPLKIHTPTGVIEKVVRGMLLCVACDLPAARKVCGFLGHNANLGCSKCLKLFPGQPGSMDFSGFNRSDWTSRTDAAHRESVKEVQKCQTKTTRTKKESDVGCRYSVLLDLPYFDVVKMHIVDPMHNLFLGTGKHMIQIWIKHNILSASNFESIQTFVDQITLPSDVGRIP